MADIRVIAQNFDIFKGDGLDPFARTGKISFGQIYKAGAEGAILGHSEVNDEPEIVNKKLVSIIDFCGLSKIKNISVVVLAGESWEEYNGSTPERLAEVIRSKCNIIFRDIPKAFLSQIIIGYEPKWGSRGSGRDDMPPPQPSVISFCIEKMKQFIGEKYGSGAVPYFIYGGRSTPERTEEILRDRNINGLILGSACNTIKKTIDIANVMRDACRGRTKILVCNFKAYDLADAYEAYFTEFRKLPEDFAVLLAPSYTDIRAASQFCQMG